MHFLYVRNEVSRGVSQTLLAKLLARMDLVAKLGYGI